MDERIDVLDEVGRPTGKTVLKSVAHRKGLWHRCFHCWVCGVDSAGEAYLLAQRRAAVKDTWPGWLDVTVAGHLASGEETLDGRRELAEEIGLEVGPERLVPLGTRRVEAKIPQGCDREFHEVFLLLESTPPEEFRLQKEEVEALLRIALDDAETLVERGSVPAVEHSRWGTSATRVRLSDFIPDKEDYIGRVAGAARRVIAGERTGRVFQTSPR